MVGVVNFAFMLLIVGGIFRFIETKFPETKLGAALSVIY